MTASLSKGMIAIGAFATALVLSGVAYAGAGMGGENGTEGTVQSAIQSTKTTGTLPFTGSNLAIFLGLALLLGLIGFTQVFRR